MERHPHIPVRKILDRVVLGGSDGVIECLAMTAALNGSGVPLRTIMVAGLAFSVAGALSMFFSSYLSGKSEADSLRIDMERERMEIETEPEEERAELEALLKGDGYGQKEIDVILAKLAKDKDLWLREQLRRELHLHVEDASTDHVRKSASAGLAFLGLSLLVLLPYALGYSQIPALAVSVGVSMLALFVLSSKVFTLRHFVPRAGAESVAIGALAALLLYVFGVWVSTL